MKLPDQDKGESSRVDAQSILNLSVEDTIVVVDRSYPYSYIFRYVLATCIKIFNRTINNLENVIYAFFNHTASQTSKSHHNCSHDEGSVTRYPDADRCIVCSSRQLGLLQLSSIVSLATNNNQYTSILHSKVTQVVIINRSTMLCLWTFRFYHICVHHACMIVCSCSNPCGTTGVYANYRLQFGNYFPHKLKSQFIQCNDFGKCFRKSCPRGTRFSTTSNTCT